MHFRTTDGPGVWGMVVALFSDGTLYVSLIFGWLYLWTAAPQWAVPAQNEVSLALLIVSGLLLTAAAFLYLNAVSRLKAGVAAGFVHRLWWASGLAAGHVILLVLLIVDADLQFRELAHDSIIMVALMYAVVHSGLAVSITALQAVRSRLGYVGCALPYEALVVRPFWLYTLGVFWITVAVFFLLPLAWTVS